MNRRLQTVALLSLMVAVAACGKSEKPPAEAASKKAPAAEGKKSKEAAKSVVSSPKADDKTEAKQEAPKAKAAPKASAAAAASAATTVAVAATPNSRAIVVAGISSLDAVLGKFKAMADTMGMGMLLGGDPKQVALARLKEVLEVSDISWFDSTRSTRLAVFDPKKFGPNGTAIVLPITDSAKLLASLKADAKKDQDGHAAVFTLRGAPQYLNLVSGYAVLSPSSEVAKSAAAEFTGPLASWSPRQALEIVVNMSNVNGLYAQEMKDAQRMATEIYGQMAKAQGEEALVELATSNLGSVFDFVKSVKRLGMGLDARDGHVFFDMTMQGTDGSSLSKITNSMSKSSSKLTNTSPAGAWLSMAGHIDARELPAMKDMQQLAITTYIKALQLDDEALVKKIAGAFDAIWKMSEGDTAMSFAADGSFPMAMRYVTRVTDAAKVQGHYHEVTRAIVDALIAKAAGQGTKMPFAKGASLTSIVQAAGSFLGPMGIKLSASSGPMGGATVDALEVEIDWSKLPERAAQDPEAQLVKTLVGNRVQIAIAYAGNLMAIAMGPNAKSVAPRLATGKAEGGDKALEKASENNAMAMVLHFGKLVKAFEKVSPGLVDKSALIGDLVKADPFALSIRAKDGVMGIKTDIPLATVSQLLRLFSGTKL